MMEPPIPNRNELSGAFLPSAEAHVHIIGLQHEYWYVRLIAAEALAKIRDAQAVEPLCVKLGDENRQVRAAAAWALGQIGDLRAVEPLCTAFRTWRRAHRYDAARALWQIDGHRLPWRILSSRTITPAQKLNALQGLTNVTFTMTGPGHAPADVCYEIGNVQTFCEKIYRQPEMEENIQQGAESVLTALRQRAEANTLLRASAGEAVQERQELLRGASGQTNTTPPEELLRPSDISSEQTKSGTPGFLSRIFKRKKA